jgi:hypothetical protein
MFIESFWSIDILVSLFDQLLSTGIGMRVSCQHPTYLRPTTTTTITTTTTTATVVVVSCLFRERESQLAE